jgi:vacuolar-type H+-ATPase subunit I/STV1
MRKMPSLKKSNTLLTSLGLLTGFCTFWSIFKYKSEEKKENLKKQTTLKQELQKLKKEQNKLNAELNKQIQQQKTAENTSKGNDELRRKITNINNQIKALNELSENIFKKGDENKRKRLYSLSPLEINTNFLIQHMIKKSNSDIKIPTAIEGLINLYFDDNKINRMHLKNKSLELSRYFNDAFGPSCWFDYAINLLNHAYSNTITRNDSGISNDQYYDYIMIVEAQNRLLTREIEFYTRDNKKKITQTSIKEILEFLWKANNNIMGRDKNKTLSREEYNKALDNNLELNKKKLALSTENRLLPKNHYTKDGRLLLPAHLIYQKHKERIVRIEQNIEKKNLKKRSNSASVGIQKLEAQYKKSNKIRKENELDQFDAKNELFLKQFYKETIKIIKCYPLHLCNYSE